MNRIFSLFIFSVLLAFFSCDNEAYEGPLNGNIGITCEEANENLILAQDNFENVNSSNYELYCEEYREALENLILACQEDNGDIQMLLDELGECTLSSFFQVDFDESTFFADSAEANIDQGIISIKGIRGTNGEEVELIVKAGSEGTYALGVNEDNQTNVGQYSPYNTNASAWQSIGASNQPQGQITITEIDYFNSLISGTFSFTAYNDEGEVKEFTNGVFQNIRFTKGDDFFAKVDGVEFEDVQIVRGINNFGWIGFLAIDGNGENLFLSVRHNATPGTYEISENSSATVFDYSPSFQDFHDGIGSVTITLHNPETNLLMGTFSCTAIPTLGGTGTYEITEGRFCVTYYEGSFDDE